MLLDEALGGVAGRFARIEPRRAPRDLVLGLLSPVERKNCWWLAEHAGHDGPQRIQRLLRTAVWDAEAVRDDVRGCVTWRLGEPDAVLIPDETGFVKKGNHSVGVQRQYCGTAGRIENCQVAVFVSYASSRGRELIDRRIYPPASWTDDPDRCAAAGIPPRIPFATKPQLALDMIRQAVAAGVQVGWVASDELHGDNGPFRAGVRALGLGHVLAVARDHLVPVDAGKVRVRTEALAGQLPANSWHRISCGPAAKDPASTTGPGLTRPPAASPATAC